MRQVRPDGTLATLAGRDQGYDHRLGSRYDAPALQMDLHPAQIAQAPDGSLVFVDAGSLQRIGTLLPGMGASSAPGTPGSVHVSGGEYRIASESGGSIFHFDANGRHLRTTHAVTGDTLVRFA